MSNNIKIQKLSGNREVLLSYGVPGRGYVKTDAHYSKTTSVRANKFCASRRDDRGVFANGVTIPEAEFRSLIQETR